MNRLKVLVAVGISVALVAYLLGTIDRQALLEQLGRTHWGWVAVGTAAGLLSLYARARRWRYLFPPGSAPPGLVPAIMIGYMANNVLPLRAGEIVRVYVVARRWRHGFWTALATLVVERVLDSLAIVLILGVLVLLIPVPPIFRNAALIVLAIDLAGVAGLGLLSAFPEAGRRLLTRAGRRWPALERRAGRIYDRFVHGLAGIRTPAHILPLLVWTTIVWILPAIAAWTTLLAVDLHLPVIAGWVVLAFVGLGVSIPSAPGYVGVFHFAATKAAELFGVPASAGVAFAIVFHASQYLAVTLTGWAYLVREGIHLAEATHAPPPAADDAG